MRYTPIDLQLMKQCNDDEMLKLIKVLINITGIKLNETWQRYVCDVDFYNTKEGNKTLLVVCYLKKSDVNKKILIRDLTAISRLQENNVIPFPVRAEQSQRLNVINHN